MNEHRERRSSAITGSSRSPRRRTSIQRTTTGCHTCRARKVKCDEQKPNCSRCQKGQRVCVWATGPRPARARLPKRPNATACDTCKTKKLKCIGNTSFACERCTGLGVDCIRTQPDGTSAAAPCVGAFGSTAHNDSEFIPNLENGSSLRPSMNRQPPTVAHLSSAVTQPIESLPHGQVPDTAELKPLIQLYFSSIHLFGFFAFINETHFNDLVDKGTAPRELAMIMIAHVLRFVEKPSKEVLSRADAYAESAIAGTLPRTYQSFGAIELMILLLAQHYDMQRGKFTSAWLLIGNCARMMQMMSLHTFDRTYTARLPTNLSPLLSREALRRVAWATFYADTMVDGGRFGCHVVDETALGFLQLPCDEPSFANNQERETESLFSPRGVANNMSSANLGISAYLLRTAATRRRALHFAFRATHREDTVEELTIELAKIESHVKDVGDSLPDHLHYNSHNRLLHQNCLTTFILLHVLRHNLFIIVDRAALQIYRREPVQSDLIDQARRRRIAHAFPIAELIAEGLEAGIIFDPHTGVQAYVALEILLLEPSRLAATDPDMDPKANKFEIALGHLLSLIRSLAARSEIVYRLHIEAVYRLLQHHWIRLIDDTDLKSFQRDYRLVGQDGAEYDFREFRWAKLERVSRDVKTSTTMPRDEVLLESGADVEENNHISTSAPLIDSGTSSSAAEAGPALMLQSQNYDGLNTLNQGPSISAEQYQPWLEQVIAENLAQEFSLDWSTWLFDG